MPKTRAALIGITFIMLIPSYLQSADRVSVYQSKAIDTLLACRQVAVPEERLACVDRELDQLGAKVDSGPIAVVEKAQVERRHREQFGLAPKGDALFANNAGGTVLKQVKSAIMGTVLDSMGKWIFFLKDGSRWRQIDNYPIAGAPRIGTPVIITRAALNSFKMAVGGQAAIRVRRTG